MPEDKFTNHLKNETSPYLKQHVHNAVDWYPWGEEALQKAKSENKMIFLSIGYSTCHWCHVMAHESFEDPIVAQILNDHFVSIKVDREERPDLDAIYMNACQLMTGSGGWPLNLWLTPEQVPFYAGTYFPKNSRQGRPGFMEVLAHLNQLWVKDHDEIISKSLEIRQFIDRQSQLAPENLDDFVVEAAMRAFKERFEPEFGGFSKAPKFPSPHQLLFLLEAYKKHKDVDVLKMVTKTLDAMYQGGIYDHVGGGFARYSVDGQWLVPHFEKMLYDNALLLRAYNEAFVITENQVYKEVAYDILRFVGRELLSEEGGFYTALDADSEGVEGKCYVWTEKEVDAILGDRSDVFKKQFQISAGGNFEGKNIPNFIGHSKIDGVMDQFKEDNKKLLEVRGKRIQPTLDYKVLTSMNGLMIKALSHMYRVYGDKDILQLAEKARDYVHDALMSGGHLNGAITKGQVASAGVLEDYAFYIEGLIELYQATFSDRYLEEALRLLKQVNQRFWDETSGGYFMTARDHEKLIQRPKEAYDGAIPSGNSVMALNLLKLSRLADDSRLQDQVKLLLKAFGKFLKRSPDHLSYMLLSVLFEKEGTRDMVVACNNVGDINKLDQSKLLDYFTVRAAIGDQDKPVVNDQVTYYVCQDFTCGIASNTL